MSEKKKFVLEPKVFLVKGFKRGALYDLSSGNVYSVDSISAKIIAQCIKGIPIAQIAQTMEELNFEEITEYLKKLLYLKLGRFVYNKYPTLSSPLNAYEQKLNFIWLELTSKCNLSCIHCYAYTEESANTNLLLTTEDWKKIIKEAYNMECKKIQFIGGEPMLFGEDIFILIQISADLGYHFIELFSNATFLTDKDINLLAQYGVCVATSIYSNRSEIHDKITQIKGSFEKTISNVKKMQDKGIKVRFATIVMKQNEEYIQETISFLREMKGGDMCNPDIVRPVGRGAKDKILSDNLRSFRLQTKANFPKIEEKGFVKRINGHNCWQDRACITSNGDVIPCIMARDKIIGNIRNKENNLKLIFNNKKSQNYQKLSKDKIQTCKDCEYRYVCFDCRPLVEGQTGNLYAKPPNCLYNPYNGIWSSERR